MLEALPLLVALSSPPASASPVRVLLTTDLGEIELELEAARAPLTTQNFLRYVDAGAYDGGLFHRSVRLDNQPGARALIEVVQAGARPGAAEAAPIPLERTSLTGLRHTDGTLSMARAAPDSATSDFFICIGDQPALDHGGARNPDGQGFAAFGRVIRGMDVVRGIQARPSDGQTLTPPVRIRSGRRLPAQPPAPSSPPSP